MKPGRTRTLPRGRHGIPREEVVAHQRDRMLRATTAELRRRGFAGLSVAHITARARVSRVTFYDAFEDKLDSVLAAHRDAIASLEQRVREAYAGEEGWARGMQAAIAALLDFSETFPDRMYVILFVNNASEPNIAKFGLRVRERLFASVERARGGTGSRPPELAEQAAVGAVAAVLGEVLQGGASRPADCGSYLVRLVLAPYIGRLEAERIALDA